MGTIVFWFAVLIVLFLVVFFHGDKFETRRILLLSPLGLTVAMLVFGGVMAHDNTSQSFAPEWPLDTIYALLVLHIPLVIVLIQRSKGYRWFACCIIAVELLVSLWTAFGAAMLVTGDAL